MVTPYPASTTARTVLSSHVLKRMLGWRPCCFRSSPASDLDFFSTRMKSSLQSSSIGTTSSSASGWPLGRTAISGSRERNVVSRLRTVGMRRNPKSTLPSTIQFSISA